MEKYFYILYKQKGLYYMEQSQLQAVWEQILNNMRDQLAASAFKWLDPVKPLSLTDSELVLGTQTGMAKDWITSHYLTILEDAVDAVLNGSRKITMKVVESPAPKEESQTVVSVVPAQRAHKEPENPDQGNLFSDTSASGSENGYMHIVDRKSVV